MISNSENMSGDCLLIIDDDPDESALALRALRASGFANEIVVINDGEEALDYLLIRGRYAGQNLSLPTAVLLDLKMPRLDGFEVLAAIRNDERTRHLPVVILTSSDVEDDVARAYDNGANSYIRKPVEFHRFSDAITQLGNYWLMLNKPSPGVPNSQRGAAK